MAYNSKPTTRYANTVCHSSKLKITESGSPQLTQNYEEITKGEAKMKQKEVTEQDHVCWKSVNKRRLRWLHHVQCTEYSSTVKEELH